MSKPQAIVFDLDGTLIDSRRDIANAANYTLAHFELPTLPQAEVESYVGDGARVLLVRASRLSEDDPKLDAMVEVFIDHYAEHATDHTELMPGAELALGELSELPLALCTNKPRRTTDVVLTRLRLARHFRVVVAGGDLPQKKPDPAPLLHIAEQLRVSPSALVMVGDGAQDIEAARRAGARGVAVEGGIQPRDKLLHAGPATIIGSLGELPGLVRSWLT